MIRLAARIPAYWMFRRFGFPRLHPANLTLSVTYRCNSRCRTCRVYTREAQEFTLDEYDRTFASIGSGVFWITISGGEPFLRKDLAEICRSAYMHCRPSILNIPTNGILTDAIVQNVETIANSLAEARVIVNLSMDEVGERHDDIRNVPGNFAKAAETYTRLRRLKCRNLSVGIHTVISRFNVERFPDIYEELNRMKPDAYITEIAEQRVELDTMGLEIAPPDDCYARAIDYLSARIGEQDFRGMGAVTQAFRAEYYKLVKEIIHEQRQVLPCYAGVMSAQISPDGEVWACCTKAESMGNLRDADYDFRKVWFSQRAEAIRKPIRNGDCHCPLANASYTNMLASFGTAMRVAKTVASAHFGRKRRESRLPGKVGA
jgi:MoaA/NifB/PqqE/SkfB family radical SAM enzyme